MNDSFITAIALGIPTILFTFVLLGLLIRVGFDYVKTI